MLLTLREVLDLENLYTVIALSPDIVAEGLEKSHPAWGDPFRFLEKIIEYPFFIPKPKERELRGFIQAVLAQCESLPHREALADLGEFLPANPRQIKLLIRFLMSSRSLLNRFSDEEVNWHLLYLCEIIRCEFPRESLAVSNDVQAVKSIEGHHFRSALREKSPKLDENPELKHAPTNEAAKSRFTALFNGLRQYSTITVSYSVGDLLTITENPPLLTWLEWYRIVDSVRELELIQTADILYGWIAAQGTSIEASSVLFCRAIQYRQRTLDLIASADAEQDMRQHLPDELLAEKIITSLIDIVFVAHKGLLTFDAWKELLFQAGRWDHFTVPKGIYARMREFERDVVSRSLDNADESLIEAAYAQLESEFDRPYPVRPARSSELKRVLQDLLNSIRCIGAANLLRRFTIPNGVHAFWGGSHAGLEKDLLFDLKSPFYSKVNRAKLRRLAQQAGTNNVIRENFFHFLEMLLYGATSTQASFPGSCMEIVKDESILSMLWRAAMVQPLNVRTAGSLRESRNKVILELGVSEKTLKLPRWWKRLEQQGLWTTGEGTG